MSEPLQISIQSRSRYPTSIVLPKPTRPSTGHGEGQRAGLSEPGEVRLPLRQVVSQPFLMRTPTPHTVFSLQPPNTTTPANSIASSNDETLQSSFLTMDDAPSLVTKPTLSVTVPQNSPFPPRTFTSYRPNNLTFTEKLPYSHYPPSHFSTHAWATMWRKPAIDLDYHSLANRITIQESRIEYSTAFRYEMEFTGYAYRVIIDPAKCHSGIRIQCGTVVNVANLNTTAGKYIVDACQLVREDLCFFPVHFREYDGQRFTSADDTHHFSFILVVPSVYSRVIASVSPLLQKSSKSKPIRSFYPFSMFNIRIPSFFRCFTSKNHQESRDSTPRTSFETDFHPPSSLQSQKSDYAFDITADDTASERGRKYAFWFAQL